MEGNVQRSTSNIQSRILRIGQRMRLACWLRRLVETVLSHFRIW